MAKASMAAAATTAATTLDRVRRTNDAERRRERRELARQGRVERVNVGRGERLLSALLGGLLTSYGLRRRGVRGYGMALVGAELLYRGASGHCVAYQAMGMSTRDEHAMGELAELDSAKSVDVRRSIEIARPRAELYAIWRDFSKLPSFMAHLERVDVLSPTTSHWVTNGPVGTTIEWDAEIVDERENEWIAWQAIEPAQVPNNGTVMFRDTPSGTTEIFVTIEAQPPAGKLGELVARMFGKSPDRQVRMALETFKQMAEGNHDWSGGHDREDGASFADREVALGDGRPADDESSSGSGGSSSQSSQSSTTTGGL